MIEFNLIVMPEDSPSIVTLYALFPIKYITSTLINVLPNFSSTLSAFTKQSRYMIERKSVYIIAKMVQT